LIPVVVAELRDSLRGPCPPWRIANNSNSQTPGAAILVCWELHPTESESTVSRDGAHLHAFLPLASGLWNLTAVFCEFPMLPATIDGMEAMKPSRGEPTRTSSQIAAQSREIKDLHDYQMSAAPDSFRGVACNGAALDRSPKLCSAAS
jgi:hypothetical protein